MAADASINQTSFTGGEFGPYSQGRSDLPGYRTALSVCRNALPVEEGAWVRRGGFQFIVPTRERAYAKLLPFVADDACAFIMEFTDDYLRFLTPHGPCFDTTAVQITATGAGTSSVTLSGAVSWAVNDEVMMVFPAGFNPANEGYCRNRVLTISAVTSTTQISLADDIGIPLDIASYTTSTFVGATIAKVTVVDSPYSGKTTLATLRAVQIDASDNDGAVILSGSQPPNFVTQTAAPTADTDASWAISAIDFQDGPYLDIFTDTATVSGYSGSITFSGVTAYIFVAGDVGRHVRLFTQPALWASGTTYSYGQYVTDASGAWWISTINSNTGYVPGSAPPVISSISTVVWAPAPTAGQWAWGKITAVGSSSSVTVDLVTDLSTVNGTTVNTWQLGLFTADSYPTCGTYHQGRLWLAGAAPNRLDASMSNQPFIFSPSDINGNVLDDSALSEELNSDDRELTYWMLPDPQGIICGSLGGEWLISASALNDPITPTSIQIYKVTKYGCADVEPARVGMATAFVQKLRRRVVEYLADAFSGKFSGKHLNQYAKHLAASGIARLAYQEETVPILWALMNDGTLAGCTYRRFSRFVTEDPTVEGWHRHDHGNTRRVLTDICVIPGLDGLSDSLFVVTNDPTAVNNSENSLAPPGDSYFVELMRPVFDAEDNPLLAFEVDGGTADGPGLTVNDCAGGNPFGVAPTGALVGEDGTTSGTLTSSLPAASTVPGTIPSSGTARALYFKILAKAVYFDGTAALFGLPPYASDSDKLSISFWCGATDMPFVSGSVFAVPKQYWNPAQGTAGIGGYQVAFLSGTNTSPGSYIVDPNTDTVLNTGYGGAYTPSGGAGLIWVHVMLSFENSGGHWLATMYINDTEIMAGQEVAKNTAFTTFTIPFHSVPDGAYNGWSPSYWTIGGNYLTAIGGPPGANEPIELNLPYLQDGLVCSMAELYIAPGQFIDWSVQANRYKFHASDDSDPPIYAPVNLGDTGATPTGTAPLVYCAGDTDTFTTNRAAPKMPALLSYNTLSDSPLDAPT